jgi:hypothetical protein
MSRYAVRSVSTAAPNRVYDVVLDGRTWPSWSPIDSFTSEGPSLGGAVGDVRVFTTGRNVTRERIISAEPDSSVVYEIVSGSRLLRGYRGTIDLHAMPDGGTRIDWSATWEAPFPGAGVLMESFLRRFQQQMVDGLAQYAQHDGA